MDDLIRKLQSRIAIRGLEIKQNWKCYDQYRNHSELGWVYKSYALEYGDLQVLDKQLLRRLFRDRYMIRNMSYAIDELQRFVNAQGNHPNA